MKHGLKLGLFLVLLTFIVSSCANYQNPFQKKEKEEVGRGLKLGFESNTIPDVIYAEQEFPLSVLIENYGPAIEGILMIYDQIDGNDVAFQQSFTIPGADVVEDNLGRIRGKIVPGRISVPRDEKRVSYKKENLFDGARANIHAELRINNYGVEEKFPLCIKEEEVQGVPCLNNEIENFADAKTQYRPVTYSPVTIERVEKTITPLGRGEYFINLDITLNNVGGGEIAADSVELLEEGEFKSKDNIIKTPSVVFGGQSLRCSPQSEVVFVDNKAVLNCVGTTNLEAGQEYVERQTEISYAFNYKMKIKKGPIPIIIRN